MIAKDVFKKLVDVSQQEFTVIPNGVILGDGLKPKIIAQASSDCMSDNLADERFNQGIQGHCYTNQSDVIILKLPVGQEDNQTLKDLFVEAINLNAKIWEKQTGINLLNAESGQIVFVEKGQAMRDCFIKTADSLKDTKSAFLGMLKKEVLKQLGSDSSILLESSNLVETLEKKSSALELFQKLGIEIPETFKISIADVNQLAEEIQLNPDKRYILKLDGLCGGFGNFTNESKGYNSSEILKLISQLQSEQKLFGDFQIQEFLPGISFGSIAQFELGKKPSILSIHQEVQKDLCFQGSSWEPSFQRELKAVMQEIFDKISEFSKQTLVGPIGIDAILFNDKVYVIECNPRMTGASPLANFLTLENEISKNLKIGFNCLSMEVDINTSIPATLIKDGKLLAVVEKSVNAYNEIRKQEVIKELEVLWEKAGRKSMSPEIIDGILEERLKGLVNTPAMILPQGISPCEKSKVLFVNDLDGKLKEIFLSNLAST
jgi:glutathione synthase/RimK-type ligase-like ATP-grasp enzyme